MPIQPGDFTMSLSLSQGQSILQAVIGRTVSFSLLFSNHSATDALYNLGFTIKLPDGLEFVSSSVIASSNTIDSNFNNIITFTNIKNLYPNELNYAVTITIKANEYYRSNNTPVAFSRSISGILFSARADTKPRGNFDSGNSIINATSSTTLKTLRYSMSFTGPQKYVKGAGATGSSTTSATSVFTVNMNLVNNTRESSTFDFNSNLANGIRYIGNFQTSGTDASNFTNPSIISVNGSQNYVSINFSNANLSVASETTLSFDAAIWQNYTASGIENSGSLITNNSSMTFNATMDSTSSSDSFYTEWSMLAVYILLDLILSSYIIDVNDTVSFDLSYDLGGYFALSDVFLENIIPDGLSYITNTSTLTPSNINNNTDGSTSLIWNLETLSSLSSGTISLDTLVDPTYSTGTPVYSTDVLNTTLNADFTDPYGISTLLESANGTLTVVAPTITKTVTNYYYSDLTIKPYDTATVSDFIGFKIIYNASDLIANQNNVNLFDYPPLNMLLNSIPSISTSGNFPSGVTGTLVPDNGFTFDLGSLSSGTYFEVNFMSEVTNQTSSGFDYNLAMANITNSDDIVTSIRSNALVAFGTPNLSLTDAISGPTCVSLNSNYVYTLNIKNLSTSNVPNISDAFNLVLTTILPNIFSLSSAINITGGGSYSAPTLIDDVFTLNITELPVNQTLTINFNLTTSSLPLMSNTYNISNTLTNGTSQSNINSFTYTMPDLTKTRSLTACSPNITKVYLPSTIIYGETFLTNIIVNYPKGILAYNVDIQDTLLSSGISNISNLTLNGTSSAYSYSSSTNSIIVPIASTLDTTSSSISYSLEFENKIFTATTTDFEQNLNLIAYSTWAITPSTSNSFNISDSALMQILEPGVTIQKLQKNYTNNTGFTEYSIPANLNDSILYKFIVNSIGKSTAYELNLTDIIPSNLLFRRFISGIGSYNSINKTLSINISSLNPSDSRAFIIESRVIDASADVIAINNASVSFKANTNLDTLQGTSYSENIYILNPQFQIYKEQRNVTLNSEFIRTPMNCNQNQIIQYKISITNLSNSNLNNLSITDTFPAQLNFLSFEPFNNGSLSANNNNISAVINTIAPLQSIDIIYNLELTTDSLSNNSSFFTVGFNIAGQSNLFTEKSNTIYTNFSTLGRGFLIY